jgi:transposase
MNVAERIRNAIRNSIDKVLTICKNTELVIAEIVVNIMQIIGDVFVPVSVPEEWALKEIVRTKNGYKFYWKSESKVAYCPHCRHISQQKSKLYFTRTFQDMPIQNQTVYHIVDESRFDCINGECNCKNFFEQHEEVLDRYSRKTRILADHICRLGVESNAEGAYRVLLAQGVVISGDTVLRIVKRKGLAKMKEELKKDNVEVLGVDDINRRKGNSSTACTVFINAKTHQFLALVAGKDGSTIENFLKTHPAVECVTRDRATAYASGANKAGVKEQVADRFHLFDNLHDAIKKEVYHILPLKIVIGNVRSENQSENIDVSEETDDVCERETEQSQFINDKHRALYEIVKKIHSMKDAGNSVKEICKLERIPDSKVRYYLKLDPNVVLDRKSREKPLAQSIAAQYGETIVRMMEEGKKHREIFQTLQNKGFNGSRNCIYQFIKKYSEQNGIPYGRTQKTSSQTVEFSRRSIYNKLIHSTSCIIKDDTLPEELSKSFEEAGKQDGHSEKLAAEQIDTTTVEMDKSIDCIVEKSDTFVQNEGIIQKDASKEQSEETIDPKESSVADNKKKQFLQMNCIQK